MATSANIHAPMGAVTALRFVDFVLNIKASFIASRESRLTRKALSKLSTAQLEDIGLTRDDVANF